jgi:hypothetical protein
MLLTWLCYQAAHRQVALTTQLVCLDTEPHSPACPQMHQAPPVTRPACAHAAAHAANTLLLQHSSLLAFYCAYSAQLPAAQLLLHRSAVSVDKTADRQSSSNLVCICTSDPADPTMLPHVTCTVAATAAAILLLPPPPSMHTPVHSGAATVTLHGKNHPSCQQQPTRPPTSAGLQHLAAPWP